MKSRDGTLDLIRGMSALLVMLGHLRGFIFLDFGQLKSADLLAKAFYFATGLGHQAVMVFFVLSGYFVGGSVISSLKKGRFSWIAYTRARLTRLWMVLLPALILTLAVDSLGNAWNPLAYAGGLSARFMSGPTLLDPAVYDSLTFIGNLIFVQTIWVPVYGSNSPLWSLANEFWYYVMFPVLAVALFQQESKRWFVSVIQLLSCGLIAWWLPYNLVLSGLIWLMGAGVWWLLWMTETRDQMSDPNRGGRPILSRIVRFIRGLGWRLIGGLLFLATLAASKSNHWLGSDYAVGITFALWLISLPGSSHGNGILKRFATGLSEISYTLYVVHFPLLFFAAAVLLRGRQFSADCEGYLWFSGLAVAILAISSGMWWLFERNTDRVRKLLWSGWT